MPYLNEKLARKASNAIISRCDQDKLETMGVYSDPVAVARGINTAVTNLLSCFIIGLIGFKLNILPFAVVYMVSSLPLRYRFGGSHFKNPYICFIVSTSLPLLCGSIVANIDLAWYFYLIGAIFAVLSVLRNKVKDNPNFAKYNPAKKEARQRKFFIQGMIMLFAIICIEIVLFQQGYGNFAEAVLFGKTVLFINLFF